MISARSTPLPPAEQTQVAEQPTSQPGGQPTPTPAEQPQPTTEPTEQPQADSVHAEMYEAINTIRTDPYLSEWPLEVDAGLEAAAQVYAEGGAWNTGLPVKPLLVEQNVRCRDFTVMTTGQPQLGPPQTERDRFIPTIQQYLPDFEAWAQANVDYANHLWWFIQWEYWDTLFLSSKYTHFGYGAAVIPELSSPKRGNHPGVIILCEK